MIRKFLTFIFISLAVVANSQQKMRISLMVNPNMSWFTSDLRTVKPSGAIMGFEGGVVADAFFSENYAFSTGISIGSIGGSLQYNDSLPTSFSLSNKIVSLPTKTTVTYNIQYLTIPLGLKMKSIEIGYITYYAEVGLNTHFTIASKGTSNDAANLLDKDNISKEINFFNVGYHIGGGIEYAIGGHNAIVFGVLYNHGFLDITDKKTDNIQYNSVSIRIGFLF